MSGVGKNEPEIALERAFRLKNGDNGRHGSGNRSIIRRSISRRGRRANLNNLIGPLTQIDLVELHEAARLNATGVRAPIGLPRVYSAHFFEVVDLSQRYDLIKEAHSIELLPDPIDQRDSLILR